MREVKEQLSLITFLLLSSFYGGQPPNPQASLRSKVDEKGRKENIIVKIGERVLSRGRHPRIRPLGFRPYGTCGYT